MSSSVYQGRIRDPRPLVAHVVFRFDYGGLENGVVNLINGLPAESFRHAVVALTTAEGLRGRIARPDVGFHSLHKRPGKDPALIFGSIGCCER